MQKVAAALTVHLAANYKVYIPFREEEVRHFFLPKDNVVQSYLIENEQGEGTDFISFYVLNSHVLDNPQHTHVKAAYAFYNFAKDNDAERMRDLMRDLLVLAKNSDFDVFNMTAVLKHGLVKEELLFKPGDGRLAHYLYNWRIQSIADSDIGIVLV